MLHLEDICEISSGFSFRGSVGDKPGGTYAVVQLGDIDWDGEQVSWASLPRVSGIEPLPRHLLQAGDVLFAAKGRVNRAILITSGNDTVPAATFFVLRPHPDRLLPAFLAWYINTSQAQGHIQAGGRGTNIQSVPKACIASLPVPVPPLSVQHGIAEAIRLAREQRRLLISLGDRKTDLVEEVCLRAVKDPHSNAATRIPR